MIPYIFHAEAEVEFASAALYYESQSQTLKMSFLDAVARAIARIQEYPESGSRVGGPRRRTLVAKFPYAVIYRVDEGSLFILSISHLHRQPAYWMDRE